MSDTNFLTKIVTYGIVFLAGYYLGGGCENSITRKPANNSKTNSKMEEKIEEYEYRLNELENKLEEKE